MQNNYFPESLVQSIRSGLVEEEHFGFVVFSDGKRIGNDNNYPFFLRSCAKPLQASLLIDYGIVDKFTSEELALCCASHWGEDCHLKVARHLLEKFNLKETDLKCGSHDFLSETSRKKYSEPTILHNNCSGKHIMMLAICREKGWDLKTYDDMTHPLQVAIKQKIDELCEITSDYPVTKDGCGVPIFSMPLFNLTKGYTNLFGNPKYFRIKEAYRENPYIIGGEKALDTEIMQQTNLIAKVGAGGLCVVFNSLTNEAFVVKVCDCDKKARKFVTCELINKLDWGNIVLDNSVKTLHGEVLGKISTNLQFS